MPRYNTTKKDFSAFKRYCKDAIAAYKLGNWAVKYEHKLLLKSLADISLDLESETATLILSTDWSGYKEEEDDPDGRAALPVTAKELKRVAVHEVRHMLLQPLVDMLDRYNADEDEVLHVEHVIVLKMEHADTWKRGKK